MSANPQPINDWTPVKGKLTKGYGIASGQARHSPYPGGSIVLQTPHFLRRGLDIRRFFQGTLNISITPLSFRMKTPRWRFDNLEWCEGVSETFSFSPCRLMVGWNTIEGLIYYPHPETKPDHFHDNSTLEVLAPFIGDLEEGAVIFLWLPSQEIEVV
ncbi:MAG: hypothetical protein AB1427_16870 [Thermodesulfobacteriota bacterium]